MDENLPEGGKEGFAIRVNKLIPMPKYHCSVVLHNGLQSLCW